MAVALLLLTVALVAGLTAWYVSQNRKANPAEIEVPLSITLQPKDDPGWKDVELIERWSDELCRLGFEPRGNFEAPELPGNFFCAFVHPIGYGAGICEMPDVGPYIDISAELVSGRRLLVSSLNDPDIEQLPWEEKFVLPGAAPADLLGRLEREIDIPVKNSSESIVESNNREWCRIMRWMAGRRHRVEDVKRMKPDVEDVRVLSAMAEALNQQADQRLPEACLHFFFEDHPELDQDRSTLQVIHERMDTPEVLRLFGHSKGELDYARQPEPGESQPEALALFEDFNERLDTSDRFEIIGRMEDPVRALIVRSPSR